MGGLLCMAAIAHLIDSRQEKALSRIGGLMLMATPQIGSQRVATLSDLGRREEALAAAQEAVDIYRDLARARPEAFTPDLAMSLNNLANCLSALGRREEALAAAQEAVPRTSTGQVGTSSAQRSKVQPLARSNRA
jgi:tetratricopeptide (TPR) repeat protein